MTATTESIESFYARVERETGVKFDKIPQGTHQDLLGGQIFARRGDTFVVSYGYPDEGPEGPVYNEFRVVDAGGAA